MKVVYVDVNRCLGCMSCQRICTFHQARKCNGQTPNIWVSVDMDRRKIFTSTCLQCQSAWCLKACPAGALTRDPETQAVVVDEAVCVGCGMCVIACPSATSTWNPASGSRPSATCAAAGPNASRSAWPRPSISVTSMNLLISNVKGPGQASVEAADSRSGKEGRGSGMKERTAVKNGTVKTLCRMCNTRCSIEVTIKDGIMTGILPGCGNPVNDGRICPRGKAGLDHFYHRDRILKPLKRMADGSFAQIARSRPWTRSLSAWRPSNPNTAPGRSASGKGRAPVSSSRRDMSGDSSTASDRPIIFPTTRPASTGDTWATAWSRASGTPIPIFPKARLILLLGSNPPVCHPPFMKEFADARSKGARLVVIDPRLNPIGCWADIFAQPCPGTDGALAWGLIHLLIQSGSYDRDFVSTVIRWDSRPSPLMPNASPQRSSRRRAGYTRMWFGPSRI